MKSKAQSGISLIMVIVIGTIIIITSVGMFAFVQKTQNRVVVKPVTSTITAAGAGSALFALPNWTEYYEKKYGSTHIEILPSSDTGIGIQGLKEKTIDIAALARKPKETEKFPELIVTKLTTDAIIFAINPSVTHVTGLTVKQIIDIYTGKIINWQDVGGPDTNIVVIDRNEQESAKQQLRESFLQDSVVVKTAVEITSEKDVLAAILSTPNSIGYLSRGRAKKAGVVILAINGVTANEGVKTGIYPLPRTYYLGYRTDSIVAVKDFIKFIETEGKGLAEQFDFFE